MDKARLGKEAGDRNGLLETISGESWWESRFIRILPFCYLSLLARKF